MAQEKELEKKVKESPGSPPGRFSTHSSTGIFINMSVTHPLTNFINNKNSDWVDTQIEL